MDELSRWYENMTYQEAKNILREKLDYMKKNFIAAGYYMKYIRDHELFREDGYESIWEFAEDNYGIKKSTASRWMSMNDKFSQGGNSPVLAEEFRDFEKSQLQEMLYLDDKQIEAVTPDMTVKEIREVRKPELPSAYGTKKKVYPEDSLIKTPGCEGGHDCFRCGQDCEIRGEDRHCRKAPSGNPFPCDTMNNISLIRKVVGNKCQFVNQDLAMVYPGSGEGNPCCMECEVPCEMECSRALRERVTKTFGSVAMSQQQEEATEYIPGKCMHNPELACSLSEEAMRTPGTGEGNCGEVCCWECLKEDCKLRCNASEKRDDREETVATSQQVEAEPVVYMDPPEEESDPETEVIIEENVEVVDGGGEELYEEVSDQSDIELLQEELDKLKNNLDLMLSCYSENDIRVRKQRLMIGALEGMISDLDTVDIPETEQPELPLFRNNDQRKEWLRNYQEWGIWYEDKNIGARYYKYDFENGARLIAEEYTRPATEWYGEYISSFMHLVGGPEPPKKGCVSKWQRHEVYDRFQNNETELVEFLKYVQKGGEANE